MIRALAALLVVGVLAGCRTPEPAVLTPPAGSLTVATFELAAPAGSVERIVGARVAVDFFQMMKAPPLLGRTFVAADMAADAQRVAVLQESLWRSKFNGEPSIIGRTVQLDGAPVVIVGVVPRTFRLAGNVELFVPKS